MSVIDHVPTLPQSLERHHPFHSLGVSLPNRMTRVDALEFTGSDDYVTAENLYIIDPNSQCGGMEGDDYVNVPGKIATFSDKYGPLGVMNTSYEIFQRSEALDFAYDILGLAHADEEEAYIDAMGNPHNGKQFYTYIRFPELVIDPNGVADEVERGLWVATSFDGSLPNTYGYSAVRLFCKNQLTMHLRRGLSYAIKVRHTKNMEERLHAAAEAMGYLGEVEKHLIRNAEKMLSVPGDLAMNSLLTEFWPIDDDTSKHTADKRRMERGQVWSLFEGTGNTNVEKVGSNGWAAYNAVVEYWDHARPVRNRTGDSTAVLQRAEAAFMPGTIADKKVKASNVVLALAA